MKINKLMLAIVALLGASAVEATGYCVITKGAIFSPVPAVVATNAKGNIVLVKKAGTKANYFIDATGKQYKVKDVGYLQYKQNSVGVFSPCNCKNAPEYMQKICNLKGHGTANRDRVSKYLAGMTQFKVAKPAEQFQEESGDEETFESDATDESEEESF